MWSHKDTPSVRCWEHAPGGDSQLQLLPSVVPHRFLKAIPRLFLARVGSALLSALTCSYSPDFPCAQYKKSHCPAQELASYPRSDWVSFHSIQHSCAYVFTDQTLIGATELRIGWLWGLTALHALERKEPPGNRKSLLQCELHRT